MPSVQGKARGCQIGIRIWVSPSPNQSEHAARSAAGFPAWPGLRQSRPEDFDQGPYRPQEPPSRPASAHRGVRGCRFDPQREARSRVASRRLSRQGLSNLLIGSGTEIVDALLDQCVASLGIFAEVVSVSSSGQGSWQSGRFRDLLPVGLAGCQAVQGTGAIEGPIVPAGHQHRQIQHVPRPDVPLQNDGAGACTGRRC